MAESIGGRRRTLLAPTRNSKPYMPIGQIIVDVEALEQLPQVLQHANVLKACIVLTEEPMMRNRQSLKPWIIHLIERAGILVEALYVTGSASMEDAEQLSKRLVSRAAVVSLGSGRVTDLTKHACHLFEQRTGTSLFWIAVQTANSVTAYTSNLATLWLNGVKRSVHSRHPDVVISDLLTLRDAPAALTLAGFGDLAAKFVASADWYLASELNLADPFDFAPFELLKPIDFLYDDWASDIASGNLEATRILTEVTLLAGLTMSMVNQSTPLSGFEHVASHVLDMLATSCHQPHASHGAQVALLSVISATLWKRLLTVSRPSPVIFSPPRRDTVRELIFDQFSAFDATQRTAEYCWQEYEVKLSRWELWYKSHAIALANRWDHTIRPRIVQLVKSPSSIYAGLKKAGAPLEFGALNPPVGLSHVAFAVDQASLVRKRFTIGDLLLTNPELGIDEIPSDLHRIIEGFS